MAKTSKLNPKCILAKKSLAINNEGIVLPCCECDSKQQWENKSTSLFMKLTELSNIKDFDTIEDVITQPVWKEFQDELLEDRGPEWCYFVCGYTEEDRREHEYHWYTDDGKENVKWHRE